MTGWLRKNAIALVAVLVLAPTTVAVTFNTEWGPYLSTRPTEPVEVANGAVTRFAGTDWEVTEVERFAASSPAGIEADLPPGSDLVAVTIRVTPQKLDEEGKSPFCTVRLGEYVGSGTTEVRSWGDSALDPIDYTIGDGVVSGCTTEFIVPYRFTAYFVIADDASDTLAVQLQVADELPRYLLLRL